MFQLLWLIPALPLAGFLFLALKRSLSEKAVASVGVGSVVLAAALGMALGARFIVAPPPNHAYTQVLWTWMNMAGFSADVSLYLDALSLVMIFVITFVGSLILLFSVGYMRRDEGFSRFFAYMDLFVGSMLVLVLARNLLLLYLGWEGVGLCSYLLIGFWYKTEANARAAMKAFVVTRVGDTAMAIGLFLIVRQLGTLDIPDLLRLAPKQWPAGSAPAVAAAALLLGGAVGKSAQLPLQTWLPDAMAGPTPVSALIHAATMVTAGVYLIARTHVLFELAPAVMLCVALIGAATLLLSGFSALAQEDIKRVLAYSTMSQIGYMFLALGVGAWSAAIFHLFTHAFFKALLFLAAGAMIIRMHEEQNLFRLGGLRKELPLTFWTFLIGCLSLTALPPATAGYASKDFILYQVWSSRSGGPWLWTAGMVGVLLTSLYTFRMFFLAFFGVARNKPVAREGFILSFPLVVLAVFSLFVGILEWPRTLGHLPLFSNFLGSALPAPIVERGTVKMEAILQMIGESVSLAGLIGAYLFYVRRRDMLARLSTLAASARLRMFWYRGWLFDPLYAALFVNPFVRLSRLNKDDFVDRFYDAIGGLSLVMNRCLSRTQSGKLRWYATGLVAGVIVIIGIVALR
jgi:NADH-quinone oxidoreductase subunit L